MLNEIPKYKLVGSDAARRRDVAKATLDSPSEKNHLKKLYCELFNTYAHSSHFLMDFFLDCKHIFPLSIPPFPRSHSQTFLSIVKVQ